jgi:hypothetical protein
MNTTSRASAEEIELLSAHLDSAFIRLRLWKKESIPNAFGGDITLESNAGPRSPACSHG